MKHVIDISCILLALIFLTSCAFVKEPVLGTTDQEELNHEQLLELNDDELIQAILDQIYKKTASLDSKEELLILNDYERNFYMAFWFDSEVCWDGSYFYFLNFSDSYLPYAVESLKNVGAADHAQLFADFCKENDLDFNDPKVINFKENEKEYEKMIDVFDEFDTAYYELLENEPMDPILAEYIRSNIDQF